MLLAITESGLGLPLAIITTKWFNEGTVAERPELKLQLMALPDFS